MASERQATEAVPTIDSELLMKRIADGQLIVTSEPIDRDASILDALLSAKSEMLEWQKNAMEGIAASARMVDPRLAEERLPTSQNEKGSIDRILDRYRENLFYLGHYADINLGYFPTSSHNNWGRLNCVSSLSIYADQIRSFDSESVKKTIDCLDLEDDERKYLDCVLSETNEIRSLLLPALQAYEEKFEDFTSTVEAIVPGLLSRRSYCCNFSGAFDKSELDYLITPGNQCVVERIEQYYDATVLENLYAKYDVDSNVIAYSHRKLGWTTFKIGLDKESDLELVLKSNFGFGNSSYFVSLLRYKGISAINAPFLIFYSGARKAEFSGHTYSYKIDEKSYRPCFNNAVNLYEEYSKIGEGAFVDKHFKKALSDLSDLLCIVAQSDTFLEITTLERFEDLTSGNHNELIPDEGFSKISFTLSERAIGEAERLSETIWSLYETDSEDYSHAKERVRTIVREALPHGGTSALQEMVTSDLVRNQLIVLLSRKIDELSETTSILDSIAPFQPGIFTKVYKGYELIEMRITKAEAVLSFIDRIMEIAEVVKFEAVLSSMEKSCRAISEQGKKYRANIIEPELNEKLPKRDQAETAMQELDARINALEGSSDTAWLKEQRKSTRKGLNELNKTIAKLEAQKDRILNFEKQLGIFED